MNNNVRFIKCTQAEYDKQTSVDNNALYFIEDTNRLYQGKKIFQGYKPLDLSKYTEENPFNAIKEGLTDGSYIVIKSGYIDMGSNAEFGNVEVLENSVLTVNDSNVIFTTAGMAEYYVTYSSTGKFQNFIITETGSVDNNNNYISTLMSLTDTGQPDNAYPLLTYAEPGLLLRSPVYYDYQNMNLVLNFPEDNYSVVLTEDDIGTKVSAPLTWGTI